MHQIPSLLIHVSEHSKIWLSLYNVLAHQDTTAMTMHCGTMVLHTQLEPSLDLVEFYTEQEKTMFVLKLQMELLGKKFSNVHVIAQL
jgi:hypothetical protein